MLPDETADRQRILARYEASSAVKAKGKFRYNRPFLCRIIREKRDMTAFRRRLLLVKMHSLFVGLAALLLLLAAKRRKHSTVPCDFGTCLSVAFSAPPCSSDLRRFLRSALTTTVRPHQACLFSVLPLLCNCAVCSHTSLLLILCMTRSLPAIYAVARLA